MARLTTAEKARLSIDLVMRPRLTPAQDALRQQYHPQGPCPFCQEPSPTWQLEVPADGKLLEFYCTSCGHYQMVEPS